MWLCFYADQNKVILCVTGYKEDQSSQKLRHLLITGIIVLRVLIRLSEQMCPNKHCYIQLLTKHIQRSILVWRYIGVGLQLRSDFKFDYLQHDPSLVPLLTPRG